MKDVKNISCLFIDHGLFLPLARHLGETFKRVMYYSPWERSSPVVHDCVVGDGFDEIERCDDIFLPIDAGEVDLVVCPDVLHAGLQLHLESIGIPVWGSRRADSIELNRGKFLRILGEVGLEVPVYEKIIGTKALAEHLKNREDVYIKLSKYRGTLETTHFKSWELDENLLHKLAIKFGSVREQIPFYVFDAIDTELELGGDTYCVDGEWPSLMLNGYECKDEGYFAAVTERKDMPDDLQAILYAFGPVLAPYRYRNQWSMEVRKKGKLAYFIDPTNRGGMPSTGSQMMAWKNFPEIIWAGANGELAEPDPACKFTAECILSVKSEEGEWPEIQVPPRLSSAMKLSNCCCVDGVIGFPAGSDESIEDIGWLVATGDTPLEVIEEMKRLAKLLPSGVSAHTDSLVDLIKEIHEAESQGIEFTPQTVPEPEVVVADD